MMGTNIIYLDLSWNEFNSIDEIEHITKCKDCLYINMCGNSIKKQYIARTNVLICSYSFYFEISFSSHLLTDHSKNIRMKKGFVFLASIFKFSKNMHRIPSDIIYKYLCPMVLFS